MSIITTGQAEIRHKNTAASVIIQPEELDWQQVSGDQGPMGDRFLYVAELDHPSLGSLSFELWEYPVGVVNDRQNDLNGHTLVRDFSVTIQDDDAGAPDDE